MKKILFIICILASYFSNAQTLDGKFYQPIVPPYSWQSGWFKTNLNIPKSAATTGRDTGAIYYKLADSSLYLWTGSQWRVVSGSGGGGSQSLQSVTEIGYTTDQPVTFEFEARFLDSSGTSFYNKLKAKNLTQNNTLYLPNKSGTLATLTDLNLQNITDIGNTSTNDIIHQSGSSYVKLTNDAGYPFVESYHTADGGKFGQLFPDRLVFATSSVYKEIVHGTFSVNRTLILPDTTGTFAMAVKLNGTRYAPGATGLIDLGTISSGSSDKLTSVSSNTTVNTSYNIYLVSTPSTDVTMSINPATFYSAGTVTVLRFKKVTNNFYTVILTPTSGSIDGASSYSISLYNETITVVSDGTNLYIL